MPCTYLSLGTPEKMEHSAGLEFQFQFQSAVQLSNHVSVIHVISFIHHTSFIIHHFINSSAVYYQSMDSSSQQSFQSMLLLSACHITFHMTSVSVQHHSSSSAASLHKLLSIFTALLTVMQRQLQCMHAMLRCVRLIGQTTTSLIGQTTAAKRVTVLWDTCVDPKVDR